MISERILQKNLRALAKEHPELARKIERAELPSGWNVFEAKNGMPTLEVEHEGNYISVHSRYDPEKETISWCKAIPDEWDVLVVFGFGLGYHYEVLFSLYPDKEIIFVENDLKHLKLALSTKDLAKNIRQYGFRVVVSQDPIWNSNEVILNHMGKNIVFRALPAYEKLFSDFLSMMQTNARDLIRQHRGNIATMERFKQQWLENYVENVVAFVQSCPVKVFFDRFENRPAIIVAAGPSLEKNIHMLNDLRERAVIIAAGSSIKALEKNGIKPHLLVSFDGGEPNYQHFKDFDGEGLPLVFAPIIYPRIIKEYKGPLIGFELDISFVRWFNQKIGWDPGLLISGPSIANVCFDLAKKMGANPIVLVGQDLAYTDWKTHADGVKHQRVFEEKENEYIMVEDVFGGKVPTTGVLLNMKTWFEQQLRFLSGKPLVIDASEGGAKIGGTEILTLKEVAERYLQEKFYPQTFINEIIHANQHYERSFTGKLIEAVEDIMNQHKKIENYCQKGLSFAMELNSVVQDETISGRDFAKVVKEFKKLDREITNLDYFQVFIKMSVAPRFQAINLVLGKRLIEERVPRLKLLRLTELYRAFFEQTQEFAHIVFICLQEMKRIVGKDFC